MANATPEKLEEISMLIIANSGAGRSAAFNALAEAKRGNYAEADAQLAQADDYLHQAHETHRELLMMDAQGEVGAVSVLLAHAQDHLMNSTLANELIHEMVTLYRKVDEK